MVDVTPRREFINIFSDVACTDSDSVTELAESIDNLRGITSRCSYPELYFSFVLDGVAHPLLTMAVNGPRADIYITPNDLRRFLSHHGRFPFEADDLLTDLRHYLISNQYGVDDYPNGEKYYLDPYEIMEDMDNFIESTDFFIQSIID